MARQMWLGDAEILVQVPFEDADRIKANFKAEAVGETDSCSVLRIRNPDYLMVQHLVSMFSWQKVE